MSCNHTTHALPAAPLAARFGVSQLATMLGVLALVLGGLCIATATLRENSAVQTLTHDLQKIANLTAANLHKVDAPQDAPMNITRIIAREGWLPATWTYEPGLRQLGMTNQNYLRFGNYQVEAEMWNDTPGQWRLHIVGVGDCTVLAQAVRNFVRTHTGGVYQVKATYNNDPGRQVYNTRSTPPQTEMPLGNYCVRNGDMAVTAFEIYLQNP